MSAPDLSELFFYVVQNSTGQFFRRKGHYGYGSSWVDDIKTARIYVKLGPARAAVTYFSSNPAYPIPTILKLGVGVVEVIDESERVAKALLRKATAKEQQKLREAKYQLERAQRDMESAKTRLERAKRGVS
jgi:hypothetical protein